MIYLTCFLQKRILFQKEAKKCQTILKTWVLVAQNLLLKICAKFVEYLKKLSFQKILSHATDDRKKISFESDSCLSKL